MPERFRHNRRPAPLDAKTGLGGDSKRAASDKVVRGPSAIDLATSLGVLLLTPVAWLVPPGKWPALGRALARFALRFAPQHLDPLIDSVAAQTRGRGIPYPPRALIARGLSRFIESNLCVLRAHRPGGWTPDIVLDGKAHIEQALHAGRGVVLWISHFHFYSLIAKMALHRAGIRVAHLSHPQHGYSKTRFGMRFLNPIRARVEDRYLEERVLLPLGGSPRNALQTLHSRVVNNGVVSIAARSMSRRAVTVPFLNGWVRLAPGAPKLAHASGAALLPVHTVADESGVFRVIVGAEIPVPTLLSGEADLKAAASRYVAGLERVVLRYPDHWRGWFYL